MKHEPQIVLTPTEFSALAQLAKALKTLPTPANLVGHTLQGLVDGVASRTY